MALRVNVPSTSSIPESIFRSIIDLNSQLPSKWVNEWLASLIDDQSNDIWKLKLTSEDGASRCEILSAAQQNSRTVCASVLELRDKWVIGQ